MENRRISHRIFGRLKAQMIIPMRCLTLSARMDQIGLRCHLIMRPQPSLRHCRNKGVRKVARKHIRVRMAQLLQRIPNTIIRPRLAEMIRPVATSGALLFHNPVKDDGSRINRARVRVGPA